MRGYRLVAVPFILVGLLYGLGPEPGLFGFGQTHSLPTLALGLALVLLGVRLATVEEARPAEDLAERTTSGG